MEKLKIAGCGKVTRQGRFVHFEVNQKSAGSAYLKVVGQILNIVDATGQRENIIIDVNSDHPELSAMTANLHRMHRHTGIKVMIRRHGAHGTVTQFGW